MPTEPKPSETVFPEHNHRRRDLIALGVISWGVTIGFFVGGSLSAPDAALILIVSALAALAYYIGSSPRQVAAPIETAKTSQPSDRFRALLEETVDAISQPAFLIDRDNRLAAFNPEAQRLFQIRSTKGSAVQSVFRDPALLGAIRKARSQRTSDRIELVRKREVEQVWQCDLSYIDQAGCVLLIASDLTAVKRAERARADFLANASHELRTPLTSIAGFIETMQGPAADDKDSWDRFLGIMHDQTERMRRLISDLLSLSRIELAEHERPQEQHNLAAIAGDVVDALRVLAEEKGASIALHGGDERLPIIAVRDELVQVIQNLTDNALKYAPAGTEVIVTLGAAETSDRARTACARNWSDAARITICSTTETGQVPCVWLRVEDAGPGIDPVHLPRLGERFYRADASRGGKITGTGLGLAIAKHIMTRHSGGFAVESQPGIGTAFGIWLPMHQSNLSQET